jgi:Phage integrase, N-terminal SAM-like domain
MNSLVPIIAVSPLRQRLIDEMEIRRFGRDTQRNYIRDVGRFATWLGRSPDTATAEEVRRFQVEQCDLGVPVPTITASYRHCGSSLSRRSTGKTWRASWSACGMCASCRWC